MRGFGRLPRVLYGLRSLAAVALAVGGALLAIDLADWRYLRLDLSASGRNTLDDAIVDVIDQLPEPVVVDAFFLPLQGPYAPLSAEVQRRVLELLSVAESVRRNRFELRLHGPGDFAAARARQGELQVEGWNVIVYSSGGRKTVQRLFGDVAVVDWGNPTQAWRSYLLEQGLADVVDPRTWDPSRFEPPQLASFRGEEALAQALLKVASGSAPKVCFSTGQGEPSLHGTLSEDLSGLRAALERDGFEVSEWDPAERPVVPEDCELLALVGPTQPLPEGALDAVREYVRGGGRVIAAPALTALEREVSGGAAELLRGYGMTAQRGVVCEPVVAVAGPPLEGIVECAMLRIGEGGLSPSHPLTEPLLRRGRRVQFTLSPAFRRGALGPGGTLLELVFSSPDSWLDRPGPRGSYDYRLDPATEERDRQRLVMLAELAAPTPLEGTAVRKGRVLGIATAGFLANGSIEMNRDFLLNAFNWMAERDHRLRVSPLRKDLAYLDLERSNARPVLAYALYLGLPAACLAVGGLLWWRRRS